MAQQQADREIGDGAPGYRLTGVHPFCCTSIPFRYLCGRKIRHQMQEEQLVHPSDEPSWYESWFDSPYYHILYKSRDESEARSFIDALLKVLRLPPRARILDLACGKGRFSRYLADKGFDVTGVDLSVESITYARQFERENLSFFTHDMRHPFRINYFDGIFSFFTSFGYFEKESDDLKTLKSARTGLVEGGVFVLDFFNAQYVESRLLGREEKELEGVRFRIHKYVDGLHVYKTIAFEDRGTSFQFQERVRLLGLADFERLFRDAGMQLERTFGDYQLQAFDPAESPRLILVATARHD